MNLKLIKLKCTMYCSYSDSLIYGRNTPLYKVLYIKKKIKEEINKKNKNENAVIILDDKVSIDDKVSLILDDKVSLILDDKLYEENPIR